MMIVMKLLGTVIGLAMLLGAAPLASVKTVYLFPMTGGLDQYLATELAQEHVFRIVFDPKTADAILTDRIGPSFEEAFDKRVLEAKRKSDDIPAHAAINSAKGVLFLVDRTKTVVWSTYQPPRDNSSKQMLKAAKRAVEQLKLDLSPAGATAN